MDKGPFIKNTVNTKKLRILIQYYFASVGVLAHVVLFVALVYAISTFQLTPRQLIVKVFEKAGIDSPTVVETLSASPMFPEHQLDGVLRQSYPRILVPELSSWNGNGVSSLFKTRYQLYEQQGMKAFQACDNSSLPAQAVCWVTSADKKVAKLAIEQLKQFQLETPDVQAQYGNAWQLAFSYDLLATYPDFKRADHLIIRSKLKKALSDYLILLDDSGPSLWHGRATLASSAWLISVTLDGTDENSKDLIRRAQSHFLDVVKAAEITEAWPEGYNYWIQNRALLFALAASAYVNGLEGAVNSKSIMNLLERIGLWHIYATRPDDKIEGFGDEGSRIDLKDETRRVIDIIAQTTRNPAIAQFSRYIEKLHGNESYYRGYRWGFPLFNDPGVFSLSQLNKELTNFRGLPATERFGPDGANQFYIRSGWSDRDTFISYRAGHRFTHHGHNDAGHFAIFKGEPLAINSSVYGNYTGDNRLNYSIRTIAKNSLLVLRPGEKVQPNRFFETNISDGGQRVIFPTGSTIDNVEDWKNNLFSGQHYEGGTVIDYEFMEDRYTYIRSDLTGAYNNTEYDEGGRGGKVKQVVRSLVYLSDIDKLIVFDEIDATDASYTKKWLLHSKDKPESSNYSVLKGDLDNGILQTSSKYLMIKNRGSYLHVQNVFPGDSVTRIVGGPDYQ